ncbi:MAG TPA: serine/threonine-protein kinase, partial [Planctomycetota bacterium]|nr:serine/threonine-protein kinase [Planctomycetota bacterium]
YKNIGRLQILQAMLYAHRRDIIHRDLKPANIFIDDSTQNIKIGDFGLAKFINKQNREISSTGEILGTPAFMSPEQIYSNKKVGVTADLYSIGCILYYMLMGKRPYHDLRTLNELGKRKLQTPPKLSNILGTKQTEELQKIIDRSMVSKLSKRYASATDFLRELFYATRKIEKTILEEEKQQKKNKILRIDSFKVFNKKDSMEETFTSSQNCLAVEPEDYMLVSFQEELMTFLSTPSALCSIVQASHGVSEEELLQNTMIVTPTRTSLKDIEELIEKSRAQKDILTTISSLMRSGLPRNQHLLLMDLRNSLLIRGKMFLQEDNINNILQKGSRRIYHYLDKYSKLSDSSRINKKIYAYFESLLQFHLKEKVHLFRTSLEQCESASQLKNLLEETPIVSKNLLKIYPFLETMKTVQNIYEEFKIKPNALHQILNKYYPASKELRIRRAFEKMLVAEHTESINDLVMRASSLENLLHILQKAKDEKNSERSIQELQSIITAFIAPTSKISLDELKIALNFIPKQLRNKISLLVRQYLCQELATKTNAILKSQESIPRKFKSFLNVLSNPRYDYSGITIYEYGTQELKQKIESVRYHHKNIRQVFNNRLPSSLAELMEKDKSIALASRVKNIDNCLAKLKKWETMIQTKQKFSLFPGIVNLFKHYGNINFSTKIGNPITGYQIAQLIMAFYCTPSRNTIQLPDNIHADIHVLVHSLINDERKKQLQKLT